MREILFRGKTLTGRWVEGAYYKQELFYGDKEDAHIIITSKDSLANDFELMFAVCTPETIGQYTGLTDNNGKKIFEGDIVRGRHWTSRNNKNPEEYHLWLVNWNEKSGLIVFANSPTSRAKLSIHDFADFEEVEVIGNIYDNPELLKGGETDV